MRKNWFLILVALLTALFSLGCPDPIFEVGFSGEVYFANGLPVQSQLARLSVRTQGNGIFEVHENGRLICETDSADAIRGTIGFFKVTTDANGRFEAVRVKINQDRIISPHLNNDEYFAWASPSCDYDSWRDYRKWYSVKVEYDSLEHLVVDARVATNPIVCDRYCIVHGKVGAEQSCTQQCLSAKNVFGKFPLRHGDVNRINAQDYAHEVKGKIILDRLEE